MMAPEAFSPIPNKWGAQGWTAAKLARLSTAQLRDALQTAHAHALPAKKKRK
jgi:hypothetical protein